MIGTIVILVVVLSVLVFVHEFGHFAVAKFLKMKVEEFGFGFPPRLIAFKKKETTYSINWIPLGGFVRIKGEAGERLHDRDSFAGRPPWQRAAVIVAGVVMNLALAWCLLSVGYAIGLPQVVEDLPPGARVAHAKIQIFSVLKDTPAAAAGFEAGDTVVTLDGQVMTDIESFRAYTASRADRPIATVIERSGRRLDISVTPRQLAETGQPGIGAAIVKTGLVSYPIYLAPIQGLVATGYFIRDIFSAFYELIHGLIAVRRVTVEFSGPVGIAVVTAEVVKLGFRYLLQFTALLSVNLAVINVLPFPALDGGRLLFLAIEKLRRRAVNARLESLVHNVGFALLMLLVLVITYRDVVKFGDRILETVSGMITGI